MKLTVRGVRSVDIEMGEPERAAKFYSKIWNLTEVERNGSSIWFRGTGAYHHILAIHPAKGPAAMRRLTLTSMMPLTFPAVRIVVTPPARYSREKLTPSCPYTPGPVV